MNSPIILALDDLTKEASLMLAKNTTGSVWGYKIHELVLREGFTMISDLKEYGKVFVDFKFHDIPTTVYHEVVALRSHGVDLISVHASGGSAMLEAAVRAGGNSIVAITLLSSFSEEEVEKIYDTKIETFVADSVRRATDAGIQHIVCSPHEIALVESIAPTCTIITPGIREYPTGDDQNRSLSAREAMSRGANLIVIGRPITKAPEPQETLKQILATLT